jgi:hypothetical protein
MIVRFDPKKLQHNTMADIGVESEAAKEKGAISEVEMIVGGARRYEGMTGEGAVEDGGSEELRDQVIREHEDEDEEPGPELTPEGGIEAEKILTEKKKKKKKAEGEALILNETIDPASSS